MADTGGGSGLPPRLVVLAGRKGRPSLLPFAAVLLFLLAVGLVGLLLLNTALNKGAFSMQREQKTATKLTQEEQLYQQDLAKLSEPGALASRAQQLGLVPNGNPAFLDPNTGALLGSPTAASTPTPVPPTPPRGGAAVLVPNTPVGSTTPPAPTTSPAPSGTPTGTSTATPTGPPAPSASGTPSATGR
jgi:hypothetical protein